MLWTKAVGFFRSDRLLFRGVSAVDKGRGISWLCMTSFYPYLAVQWTEAELQSFNGSILDEGSSQAHFYSV